MYFDSVVLIGEHGSGKDTIGKHIVSVVEGASIVKFGAFGKLLVSKAFNLSLDDMECKETRETTKLFGLSALDLLNLLFQAGSTDTKEALKLREAYQSFAITIAKVIDFPVFTDIRRMEELDFVREGFNPLIIGLEKLSSYPRLSGDEHVDELMEEVDISCCTVGYNTPEQSIALIESKLRSYGISLKVKPKLFICNSGLLTKVVDGTTYIGMNPFCDVIENQMPYLSDETACAMLQAFLDNANAHEILGYFVIEKDKRYTTKYNVALTYVLHHISKTHDIYIQEKTGEYIQWEN